MATSSEILLRAGTVTSQTSVLARSPLEEEVSGLFAELRSPLLRYLLSFGLVTEDAEEVVQEVFLSLFRHLQRGGSRTNLRGWVFRVGHNLALKRRLRDARNYSLGVEHGGDSYEIADPAPNPEARATQNQTAQRLQAVWRALPEQDRSCLTLRAEGLRYREIAQVLDISLGSVSISVTRALARIARAAER